MNNAEVLIKFNGDTAGADKATDKIASSIGNLTSKFTLANVAAQAITKTIEVFKSGLDDAINRVDTMNNFPRVMSNLGISADESAEVIEDLSVKLQGIPTTLDAAASAVQRFASKNGDVKQSEKVFLAVNNAILAGGASSSIQASALEQLSQAYAKGKPDMMEWRTLMTAMPAQLKQVANAMGYADAALLGEAVRAEDGEAVFAQMIDTMVRMNDEGVNGFKSFDEQARNATGGIGTSMTNMKTAFVRGIGDMIMELDKALEPFGGLSGVLKEIGKFGEKVFKKIGEVLAWVIPHLIKFAKWVKKNQSWLKPLTVMVITFVAALKTIMVVKSVTATIKAFFTALTANPMSLLIAAIAALVAGFIYLWNTSEDFRNFWIGLWNGITGFFKGIIDGIIGIIRGLCNFIISIPSIIVGAVQGIISFVGSIPEKLGFVIGAIVGVLFTFVTQTIPQFIADLTNAIVTFVTQTIPEKIAQFIGFVAEIPGKVWEWISKIPGKIWKGLTEAVSKAKEGIKKVANAIVDGVKKIPEKIYNIGVNIVKGLWNGIKSMAGWIGKKVGEFCGGIVKGFKSFFGIHSPSVVLEKQVGVNLGLGVVEGLDDTKKDINNSIADIATGITTNIGSNFKTSDLSKYKSIAPITYVYVDSTTDPLGQTVSNIKTFSGGAKNDYNYGMGV